MDMVETLKKAGIIPVIVIEDEAQAVPVVANGLTDATVRSTLAAAVAGDGEASVGVGHGVGDDGRILGREEHYRGGGHGLFVGADNASAINVFAALEGLDIVVAALLGHRPDLSRLY